MNKYRLLLSAVIALIATVFALRHRSLRELQSEQAQLRRQVDEAIHLRAAIARAQNAPATTNHDALSSAERSELFRLRGEVGTLRQEFSQETNQLAKASSRLKSVTAAAASEEPTVPKQQAVVRMTLGQKWMLALMLHADANGGQLPATLVEVAKFAGGVEGAEDFELLLNGNLRSTKSANQTIVLREKQPWKGSDGRWNRCYAFADGHVEIASSPIEDFSDWEARMAAKAGSAPGK